MDKRLGPALWERFTDLIEPEDLKYKYYIYSDLISMPINEFIPKMREILAGTKTGKKIVKDTVDKLKTELSTEKFDKSMDKGDDLSGFDFDELKLENSDEESGWEFEDLYK